MRSVVLVPAALLILTTCSGVGPFGMSGTGEVAIAPEVVVLGAIGARRQLSLMDGDGSAIPPDGVSWHTSAPQVATVNGSGMVTAVGDGQATITAMFNGGEASILVTVAATLETVVEVTAVDQSDSDPADNRVVTRITVTSP